MLNAKTILVKALGRLAPRGQSASGIYLMLLATALPAALNTLATQVSMDGRRRLLQKVYDFTIDLPTQSADIATTGLDSPETLLLPSTPTGFKAFAQVRVSSSTINPQVYAYFVPDRYLLSIKELNDGNIYYTVEEGTMYFNSGTAIAGTTPKAHVLGNFVPGIVDGIINIRPEFEDDLIAILIMTYTGAMAQQQAA